MMQAKQVAMKLKANGIAFIDFSEGNEFEDGEVNITPLISIQVPTYGSKCCVVHQNEEGFEFYPERGSIDALKKDLRAAMGFPRTADPRRHDHEAWVKARRRELRRNRQVLGVIAVLIVAILIEICR